MLFRSQSDQCPFSPLPFGQVTSGDVGSGLVAEIRAVDSTCLGAFSFGADVFKPFGGRWAGGSGSLAGDARVLANKAGMRKGRRLSVGKGPALGETKAVLP